LLEFGESRPWKKRMRRPPAVLERPISKVIRFKSRLNLPPFFFKPVNDRISLLRPLLCFRFRLLFLFLDFLLEEMLPATIRLLLMRDTQIYISFSVKAIDLSLFCQGRDSPIVKHYS
jgi:hypothetical protein